MKAMKWLAIGMVATLGVMGCGDDDNGDNGEDGHADLGGGVEVFDDGGAMLGQWDRDDGWRDEDGETIEVLPLELEAGGEAVELEVIYYDRIGAIEMEVESVLDEETGERECSEWSARYYPVDDDLDTDVIAWPGPEGPVAHPDSAQGGSAPTQFAERSDGEVVQLFTCDRVHLYPENEGDIDLEFHLWHINHTDGGTRPITVEVGG